MMDTILSFEPCKSSDQKLRKGQVIKHNFLPIRNLDPASSRSPALQDYPLWIYPRFLHHGPALTQVLVHWWFLLWLTSLPTTAGGLWRTLGVMLGQSRGSRRLEYPPDGLHSSHLTLSRPKRVNIKLINPFKTGSHGDLNVSLVPRLTQMWCGNVIVIQIFIREVSSWRLRINQIRGQN